MLPHLAHRRGVSSGRSPKAAAVVVPSSLSTNYFLKQVSAAWWALFLPVPLPPLICEALRLGNVGGRHALGDNVPVFYRPFVPLRRRDVEPHVSPHVVLWHALAPALHGTEVVLGVDVTLLCRPPPPRPIGLALPVPEDIPPRHDDYVEGCSRLPNSRCTTPLPLGSSRRDSRSFISSTACRCVPRGVTAARSFPRRPWRARPWWRASWHQSLPP